MSIFSSPWFWSIVQMFATWGCCYACYRLGYIKGKIVRDRRMIVMFDGMLLHIETLKSALHAAQAHLNHMKANR